MKLELTEQEIDYLVNLLAERPIKEVVILFNKIQKQINEQNNNDTDDVNGTG